MKISRRELNQLIEAYLLEEQKINEVIGGLKLQYELPTCDFRPDPRFLDIFNLVFNGKQPVSWSGDDANKPDWLSPVFLDMFQDTFLPFVNYFVMPQFGIKAKCRVMQRTQDMFNEIYDQYKSGLATVTPTAAAAPPESLKDSSTSPLDGYDDFWKEVSIARKRSNILLTPERRGKIVDNPPSGLSNEELVFASFLLGNLDEVKGRDVSKVINVVKQFKYLGQQSVIREKDFVRAASAGIDIPGYDERSIRQLFRLIFSSLDDPQNQAKTLQLFIDNLFNKLSNAGIL
tara:strand:- start:519 stop:1382 length:864 start_codon:yes stop_codon:yes gene_type:complete